MKPLDLKDVTAYVEQNIGSFHQKRLQGLETLELKRILKRKNPYLFKAKGIGVAHDLVKILLDAHLSSQEETIFGDFLEGLAIFICEQVFSGRKSTTEGVDLEFHRDDRHYIVAIKSGPNWGNSSQIKRMQENFRQASKIYRTNNHDNANIIAVNGCCYGQDNQPDKGDYFKYCGQRFWEFMSGNSELYVEIIGPLGHKAKEKTEEFQQSYEQIINKFTASFMAQFCIDGRIDWEKLLRFNSAATTPVKLSDEPMSKYLG